MQFYFVLLSIFIASKATSQQLPTAVISTIEQRIASGETVGMAIGLIEGDSVKFYSFGSRTKDGGPVDEHTVFEIGSISKVFTGLLLAIEVEKGKLSLDDPIEDLLPYDLTVPTFDSLSITLGQLSDHTSGLPRLPNNINLYNWQNPYADYTAEKLYAFLSEHELRRAPGSEYEYSNLAAGLLGHLMELHTGKPFEELIREHITKPLGMNATAIELSVEMKNRMATGHMNGSPASNWDFNVLAGAGGIRSTVVDMTRFIQVQMGTKDSPISNAIALSHQQRHAKAGGAGVSLGWHLIPGSNGTLYMHNGGTGGYSSFAGYVKETGTGVVILTNSGQKPDDIGLHILDPTFKLP